MQKRRMCICIYRLLLFTGGRKMALLEVTNLSHSFAEKVLYKDSSFELYKGEHMGIVRTKWYRKEYTY